VSGEGSARMAEDADKGAHLTGQLLVAMPHMEDPRFRRSVVYLCSHSPEGAMGLIVNKRLDEVAFTDIARQLDIVPEVELPVHFGGPVETGRGFVLHSTDSVDAATLVIDERFALTATVDILKAIARGGGPERRILALGYAGWAPGQLDAEIQANGWLVAPADYELVFDLPDERKWDAALARLGIDPRLLSTHMGRA